MWPLHAARAAVQCRRGDTIAARGCIEEILTAPSTSAPKDLEFLAWASDIASWTDAVEPSVEHLLATLADVAGTAPVRLVAPTLLAAARMAARRSAAAAAADVRELARVSGLLEHAHADDQQLSAHRVAIGAELSLATASGTVDEWAAAAAAWDLVHAPHEAAYSRWRAAQVALRLGHGTLAVRLLRRAATDARQHVPLLEAVAATARSGR